MYRNQMNRQLIQNNVFQCEQRWRVNNSIPAASNIGHSGARSAALEPKKVPLLWAITFGALCPCNGSLVPGRGVQIYNYRSVRGGRSNSVHGDGRAVDIFSTLPGGVAGNAKGDQIADWLVANAAHWNRTSFGIGQLSRQSNTKECYTGSHPHNDHIHLELAGLLMKRHILQPKRK